MGSSVISTFSPECLGVQLAAVAAAAPASASYPSANSAFLIPLVLSESFDLRSLWWVNGSLISGNVDVGVYDQELARVVSTGSTLPNSTNLIQVVDVPLRVLLPRMYWLAIASAGGGAVFRSLWPATTFARVAGTGEIVTSFPLPARLVGPVATHTFVPVLGMYDARFFS